MSLVTEATKLAMSTSAKMTVSGCIGPNTVLKTLLKKDRNMLNGWVHIEDDLRPRLRSLEVAEEVENSVLSVLDERFHLDFLRLRDRVAVSGV